MAFYRHLLQISVLLGLGASSAYAAIPGPQRMLTPRLFGLTEVASGIYTDDPQKAGLEMQILSRANHNVKDFFGELKTTPRYILCTTMMCEKAIGHFGNTAETYGWSVIHLPPKAFADPHIGEILATHERVHSELLVRWGATALWDQKFPNWFNEGLATYISKDDRLTLTHSAEDKSWISQAVSIWNWGDFVKGRGWQDAYGSAAAKVADIDARLGNHGLQTLIDSVNAGTPFEQASVVPSEKPGS